MYDAHTAFCLFFFIFSYKLLFWSDRALSIGALSLTVCCALSVTQLLFPGDLLGKIEGFDRPLSMRVLADGVWRKVWDYADTLFYGLMWVFHSKLEIDPFTASVPIQS